MTNRRGQMLLPTLLLAASSFASCQAIAQVVQTSSGPVAGVKAADGLFWRGIPYAAPPTGAMRWTSPVAPKPWTATLVADKFGAS